MINLCVLFGGVSPEHEISLLSAEFILNHLQPDKYNIYPVGITRNGKWIWFRGKDYSMLSTDTWHSYPRNCPAAISPVRGEGLLLWHGSIVEAIPMDCVFPVLHGENGEDGSIQGLMQVAGISCVGAGVAASAVCMDKAVTKLLVAETGIHQAAWYLAHRNRLSVDEEHVIQEIEQGSTYPLFVKPAGTGSSVGVSKVRNREELHTALLLAAKYNKKVLVEECISGHEVEVAVLGNEKPIASGVGEIFHSAEFYDYDAKYHSPSSYTKIPADISEASSEQLRKAAVTVYEAVGCRGLARVDFFLTNDQNTVVFNEINTLPGFTSISMYPKLFEEVGINCSALLDELIRLAMEE